MNRYLLGLLLAGIAVMTALGIENSQDFLRQATDASRESISATPSSAAERTGIESAGQNVTRQTSDEGMARVDSAPNTVNSTTSSAQTTDTTRSAGSTETATPPVEPATASQPATIPATPATDQEAIPALW
ncbi:MAG: hypothetical protein ACFBSG_09790 [Leptolyngbyaceae cyanobacterium]